MEDNHISIIDTESDKVIKKLNLTNYPWGFSRLGNSTLVAVSSWDKGINIIDFTKNVITKSKKYKFNLGGVVSSKNGEYLFTVATEENKAFKIDANTLDIVDEYQTGSGPDGIGLSSDDKKIYVTNTKDGTISIINILDKSKKVINTGGKPELIHSNHDRTKLYISNFYNNVVHIVDTRKDKIIHEIKDLHGPEEAVISKTEDLLYVVNFNSSKIFVYNTDSYKKLGHEYTAGKKPIGIIPVNKDSKLYVSNYGNNSVSIIKTK